MVRAPERDLAIEQAVPTQTAHRQRASIHGYRERHPAPIGAAYDFPELLKLHPAQGQPEDTQAQDDAD